MMLVPTYVAKSGIEGVGIFAAEPLKKGATIWRFNPDFDRIVPSSKLDGYPKHMKEFFRRYAYPHHELPDHYVLEIDNGRFMNHSDTPNTDFTSQYEGWTLVDVAAGEELTCNYAEFDSTFRLMPSFAAPVSRRPRRNGHAPGVNGIRM